MTHIEQMAHDWGEDIFDDFVEALLNDGVYGRIYLTEIIKHDVINCSGHGIISNESIIGPNDKVIEKEFEFRDGNWGGTEILNYGDDLNYKAPEPVIRKFVLDEGLILMKYGADALPLMKKKFVALKPRIDEMCGKYNYDIFFSPTDKIRKHYQEYLDRNHLMIDCVGGE